MSHRRQLTLWLRFSRDHPEIDTQICSISDDSCWLKRNLPNYFVLCYFMYSFIFKEKLWRAISYQTLDLLSCLINIEKIKKNKKKYFECTLILKSSYQVIHWRKLLKTKEASTQIHGITCFHWILEEKDYNRMPLMPRMIKSCFEIGWLFL